MILIDKTKDVQTLILTLTESSDGLIGDYILVLTSDGNRSVHSFTLPINESLFTERFDLFNIPTSNFIDLLDGIYSYSITLSDKVIEIGKALVKSAIALSDVVIQANSSTKEILMYNRE